MKIKKVLVTASCAAGWGVAGKFSDAVREMARRSRGFVDPDEMTLSEFLAMVDDQRISLMLADPGEDGEDNSTRRDFACLGDNFNDAKFIFADKEEEAAE